MLVRVINIIMNHLLTNLSSHSTDIKRWLASTPICPVAGGEVLVPASSLVFNLDKIASKQLRPYIFKVPRTLAGFDQLLTSLGAQSEVTFDLLANILKEQHDTCGGDKMLPNEKRIAYSAVKYIFLLLESNQKEMCHFTCNELFLPAADDTLKSSKQLLYINSFIMPYVSVDDSVKSTLVVPLRECGISIVNVTESQLIGLLPKDLQPTDLSNTLSNKPSITNQECRLKNDCPFLRHIKEMLGSVEMQSVLHRLVQHQKEHHSPTDKETHLISQVGNLKDIRCFKKLQVDYHDGNKVGLLQSRDSRPVFFVKKNEHDEGTLFIQHCDMDSDQPNRTFFLLLAQYVNEVCHDVLNDKHVSYLREVLACDEIDRMKMVLDDLRIPEYDVRIGGIQPDLESPGSPISQEMQQQFIDDDISNLYHEAEIVAFKLLKDGIYSLIYAKITERLDDSDVELDSWLCRYRIDIGQEKPREVGGMMLYKFCRPKQKQEYHWFDVEPLSSEQIKQTILVAIKHPNSIAVEERTESILRMCKHWYPEKTEKAQMEFRNEIMSSLQMHDDEVSPTNHLARVQCRNKLHIKTEARDGNDSHKQHQFTMPKKGKQHQLYMSGQDEEHQSTRAGQDKNHQSTTPGQDEEHQSTRAGQDKNHQSTTPGQDNEHESIRPGKDELCQSTMAVQDKENKSSRPVQDKEDQSAMAGQDKKQQSSMAGQAEPHQSTMAGQDKEHQSTRSRQDVENESEDEEHQSTRPRQDEQHQPTIPKKKHSGYTNVPDEPPSLSSLPTRTRTKIKIGISGGTVNLLGNTIQLKIPEGALQSEVEIELSVLSPKEMCPPLGDKQFVIAPIIQCKPEGLQFQKPVKLTVPHCGVNVSAKHIQIWRKDKDDTGWGKDFDGAQNEEKESVKVESKRIRMRIRHFTWYATVLNFVTNFFRGSPQIELNLLVFRSNLRDSKSMWMRFYAVQDYQIESVEREEVETGFTKRGFRKRRIDVQPNGNDLQIKVMDVRDLQGEDVWEPNEAVQEISFQGLNKGGVDASCPFMFTKKEESVHGIQGIWIAEQEDNELKFKEEHFCVDFEISPSPSDFRRRSLRTIPDVAGGADGGCTSSDPENVGPTYNIYNPVYNPTIVHGNNTPVSGNQENYDHQTNYMPSSRSLHVEAAPDTPAIEDHD